VLDFKGLEATGGHNFGDEHIFFSVLPIFVLLSAREDWVSIAKFSPFLNQ
jgi:hypothetical protein